MCSTSNLAGGVVKVGAYDTGLWATPAQARRAFFKGRCVLIQEPFFKRGLDGLCFIRVDQRDDIIFDIPDPTTFTKTLSVYCSHNRHIATQRGVPSAASACLWCSLQRCRWATKFLCLCAMCGVEIPVTCASSLRHATSPHTSTSHVAHSHLLVCTLHTGHGSRTRRQTSTGGARGSTSRRHRLKARAAWSRWCPAQSHVESVSTLPSAPLTSAR